MCQYNWNICTWMYAHLQNFIWKKPSLKYVRHHVSKWYDSALALTSTHKPKARLFENVKPPSCLEQIPKSEGEKYPDTNLHHKSDTVFCCRRFSQLVTTFLDFHLIFVNESALHTQHIIPFCGAECASFYKCYCTEWFPLYICCKILFLNIKNVYRKV